MKLYWRYKKDGKWTWKSAQDIVEYYGIDLGTQKIAFDVEEEE